MVILYVWCTSKISTNPHLIKIFFLNLKLQLNFLLAYFNITTRFCINISISNLLIHFFKSPHIQETQKISWLVWFIISFRCVVFKKNFSERKKLSQNLDPSLYMRTLVVKSSLTHKTWHFLHNFYLNLSCSVKDMGTIKDFFFKSKKERRVL